ncbi:MAG: O-antigen ligase family protein [Candidatus Angelobacter sp.]
MKTSSSTASIPNPTPFLFLITAIAVLLWPDAAGMTALAVAGAIAIPLALVWIAKSPQVAIIAMVAASAIPRLAVDLAGLKARPEHIVGGMMILAIPFLWKKREQPVRWILPDRLLMAYVALNFFSSIFMSLQPAQTIKWAAQQVLAILPYFWLRLLITDRTMFRWAFRVLLIAGVIASAYAIVCFYANIFVGSELGVEVAQYGDVPATYGLQFEANILGAYSGTLSVMMLAMYLQERSRKFLIGFSFFGLLTMAISLSRGALGATLIAISFVGFFSLKRGLLNRKVVASIILASVCAVLLVVPFVLAHYTERFSTVELNDPTADPNTMTRAVQTFSAVDEILKHPFFGGGTASFQLAFNWQDLGTGWEDQGWIGNTELRVLHDTGVVGLIVFALFVFSLARGGWKVLKRQSSPELVALLASACVYLISFQATEGTLLAFTWIHLGLIGCAVSVLNSQEEQEKALAETAST